MDDNSSPTRRYNIFLSHSVRQKDFVTQLSVDLEKENQFAFSEQRPDSSQKGESYASLIQQVTRQCSIVVIVLSRDYIFSKWAMVELSAFVQFQNTENPDLILLPLFYHFLPSDLSEEHLSKEHWEELVEGDETINIALWIQAVGVLRSIRGLVFDGNSEHQFRSNVVSAIINITQPFLADVYGLSLLQGSRDILATSSNNVPRALRLTDVEDPDKTWLVKFNTCGEASESNQININRNIVFGKKDLNVAVQSIIQAMTICERMLEDLRLGHKFVMVYSSQWQYLVNSLSTRTVEQFTHYRSTIETIKGLVPREGDRDPEAGIKVLAFCVQSFVELAQSLEQGLVLLSTCTRKEWWRTVLWMPNVTPNLKKGRRNSFCVVLQQCEWSLDLVKLAFGVVKEHFTSTHALTLKTLSFKWSNVKHRLLFIDGHDSHVEDQRDELNKESLVEVEKKDSTELIESINNILQKFKSKWCLWPWVSKVRRQEQKIINFLKMKLEGPTPYPTYVSYSIQIDHQDLIYKEVVGHGSFGVVLKMEWMGEEVAVKQMKNIHRKVFEAEAAILATVQHPNIVHLIGCSFIEKDKTGMLMMELMEHDLRTVIDCRNGPNKVGPFPVIVAIETMLQVAEAMQHLRECRILHRDLKAANVLVSRRNLCETPVSRKKEAICEEVKQWMLSGKEDHFVVKLADFGLAKYQAHTSKFMTKMAGTGPWRAPEVFKADLSSTEYKWPADVYSFGVTCFEILTGGMPFKGVSPGQLYKKIKSGERPKIDSRFPTCVIRLIERCWATDPHDRPDFSQICKDLWLCKLEQFGLEVCAN